MKNKNILIVGICGVGKTWLMKSLIESFSCTAKGKVKLVRYSENKEYGINIVGNYDGSMFEGSDKLAMNVSSSLDQYMEETSGNNYNVFEGDRFSNGKFIEKFKPLVIKILGDGKQGREKRGSNQTERHLKSITTRVGNISAGIEFENSTIAFEYIENYMSDVV